MSCTSPGPPVGHVLEGRAAPPRWATCGPSSSYTRAPPRGRRPPGLETGLGPGPLTWAPSLRGQTLDPPLQQPHNMHPFKVSPPTSSQSEEGARPSPPKQANGRKGLEVPGQSEGAAPAPQAPGSPKGRRGARAPAPTTVRGGRRGRMRAAPRAPSREKGAAPGRGDLSPAGRGKGARAALGTRRPRRWGQ